MTITKDTSVSFPTNDKGRTWNWNEANTWDVNSNTVFTVPRTRTGTRMPKWRSVIVSGQNATTPLTARLCSARYTRLYAETHEEWFYNGVPAQFQRRESFGDTFLRNNQNSLDFAVGAQWNSINSSTFVDNLAKAAFYKKLKLLTTQTQGLIFLGELTETLRMLRNPLVGIRSLSKDLLSTLSRRKRANPKKWLNDIGSAWLEQSFGWNPLLNDVRNAVEAYRRLVEPVQTLKLSAGASKRYDETKSRSSVFWPGFTAKYDGGCTFLTVSSWWLSQIKVRYKGAVVTQVDAPSWQNDDLFGFQPQNFIPAAWELLPWSFLADYFTNIGDILDATVVNTNRLAWINKTVVNTVYKQGVFQQVWGTSPGGAWAKTSMSGSRGSHFLTSKNVSRAAESGLSLPRLQFNFDLTGGQLANIGALLSQANALHPQHNPRNWHR